MDWISPKLDWVASDVMLDADFNRIESNTLYLWNLLMSLGYYAPALASKLDWDLFVYPDVFARDFNRIESNLQVLKNMLRTEYPPIAIKTDWATLDPITLDYARRVERILFELHAMLERVMAAFRHSGTFHSGQGGIRV